MEQFRPAAHRAFRRLKRAVPAVPVPQLVPYHRCTCGSCRECLDNAKWDHVFAKFEVKEREVCGVFQSSLADL
jgi:hypothetical protein